MENEIEVEEIELEEVNKIEGVNLSFAEFKRLFAAFKEF